jgi:Protein of unknown function (DUF3987)/CHC2 zinc finger
MSNIAEAKLKLALPELLNELGLSQHARRSALCPFHEDKRNSFSIFQRPDGSWFWKCHAGCGAGDEITFLELHRGISNSDATKLFLEMAGVNGCTPHTLRPNLERTRGAFNWRACVETLDERHLERLADWRGLSGSFCSWLQERSRWLVQRLHCISDIWGGVVVAAHYRLKDGSWRVFPDKTRMRPLITGKLTKATVVHVFESQWDAFAVCDKLGLHETEGVALVVTRGAGNGALISGLIPPAATVFAWKQNDEPRNGRRAGEEWLKAVAAHAGATVQVVTVPEQFTDANAWTKARATADELDSALDRAEAWTGIDESEPQPLPEDLPAVRPFDFDCLPQTIRPWIEDISERMQCPPDFPAVGAMIACGSLIGRKIGIRPKRHDDWLVIPNLWGCVVGQPGLMKTPALEQPLQPLRRLVAQGFEEYQAAIRDHQINIMLRTQQKKLAEKEIEKELKGGNEQAARAKAAAHLDQDKDKPICRRYEVNDSTIEKLGELLAENANGLLLFRDELSGFLRSLDREDHAGDRAKYLEMWSGTGELTYDRIGRGTVRIPSNTLSILGGIQPDVLMAYVCETMRGGTGNDGLLQRFQLFVWPDVSRKWHNVDRWPDLTAKNVAFDTFKYLDELTPEGAGADMSSDNIPFLRFAADAQNRFDSWRAELEHKLRSDTEHPAFEAHLAKYRKLVPALALLIHLMDRDTGPVSFAALGKALCWAAYLEAHARRIFSAVLRPEAAAARELAKHLLRGDLQQCFTLREIYRKGWAGLTSKEDAEGATEMLCDLGWIRCVAAGLRSTAGRRSSQNFETNPKILTQPRQRTDKTDTIDSVGLVSDQTGAPEISAAN